MRRALRYEVEVSSVQDWCRDYIASTSLAYKLTPPEPPAPWDSPTTPERILAPGRPPELQVTSRAEKTRGLMAPAGRARAIHTFLHHELQAAELMLWAVLAYPDTPQEFKEGLVRIALDETRHMRMYAERIEALGHHIGEFAVRDWFWERIPTCPDPASFCAVMGLGLESANLEHATTFAQKFRSAGDAESARVQELVGLEEIAHARFGARWFTHFRSELEFESWKAALPAPLTPLLMRGKPLARAARKKAGQPDAFLDALETWEPDPIELSPTRS